MFFSTIYLIMLDARYRFEILPGGGELTKDYCVKLTKTQVQPILRRKLPPFRKFAKKLFSKIQDLVSF